MEKHVHRNRRLELVLTHTENFGKGNGNSLAGTHMQINNVIFISIVSVFVRPGCRYESKLTKPSKYYTEMFNGSSPLL